MTQEELLSLLSAAAKSRTDAEDHDDDDDEDLDDDDDEAIGGRGSRRRPFGEGTVGSNGGTIQTRRGPVQFRFDEPMATVRQLETALSRVQQALEAQARAGKKAERRQAKRLKQAEQNAMLMSLVMSGKLGSSGSSSLLPLLLLSNGGSSLSDNPLLLLLLSRNTTGSVG